MSQAFVEKPNLESGAFAELPDRERLAPFRGAQINHFTERSFPGLFEDQVAKTADKIAVTCENDQFTFRELNARANQLARHLRGLGVGRESLVGICVDRSLEMAVGILGILKSGASYLPLDPDYPQVRLAFMLDDARPALVLAKSKLLAQLPQSDCRVVLLDGDWPAIAENADDNLPETSRANDLAYVIYTSGSTGAPKGVMIEHGNLANYLRALDHELGITGDDRYLHTASIAFSSSRRQLMLPLSQGATVVIATSDQRKDPLALFEMIKDRGVTVMDAVPSFWRTCTAMLDAMDEEQRHSLLDNRLRLMLSASEPLFSDIPHTWMSRFHHPARHVHMFGQTETAGIVSLYRVPADIDGELNVLPIGTPIANSEIYILDKNQEPCPVGIAGELYIGGAGVGRGYLNRPELTAEKFIPHPFEGQEGARLYRTGDWARYRADGQIEFTGRRDQQVKLRGFRIELGEVETALARHPSISESVVITRPHDRAGTRLIAYFVSNGPADSAPNAGELRSFLSDRLPDYAIPSVFVRMDVLPLSANGKVNRLALPDPETARPNLSSDYVAPHTPAEERLAAIWSEVLRVDSVGVNDNFFELGGHSLLAAQIVARVRAEFKIEIALRVLFESPTIAQMAGRFAATISSNDDSQFRTIDPCTRNGAAPLSFTQQQFWLLDQAEPGSSYNVCTAVRITGALEVAHLRQALTTIVERHEILRTNVVMVDGAPVQVIAPSMRVPFEVSDLQQLSEVGRNTEIQNVFAAESEAHFDLGSDPLLRVKVLKVSADENVLLLTMHHIVCDGWSVGVLLRELSTLYANSLSGRSASLPELRIQYADFASWQRRRLQGVWLDRQLEYWKNQLAGAAPTLDLSTDYPRSARHLLRGAQDSILLPAELSDAIRRLARQEGATLFMTLLAAFQTLLFRYSGQEDIVVGSPVAGRSMLETEGLIGAFVNTLVFRADLAGNPSFREFLGRVREATLGAFSNQDVPFEKLVEELNPERKTNRTPLFQIMFSLQNTPVPDIAVEGLTFTPLKLPEAKAKFELTLEAEEELHGIRLCFEYNAALFAPETIRRMLGHLQNLLEAIVTDPARRVRDLPLLTDSERHQLLNEWSGTRQAFPEHSCIHTLFEAQVERSPDAIAAEFQGEQVTYLELNSRANQLAHFLRDSGVGPDVLVGICVHRSLEMLVGMLGVLKAGGAYVPLDPAYPAARLAFMIEDAGLSLVLTQERLAAEIPVGRDKLFCLDKDWQTIARQSEANPVLNVASTNLAYVIYTSGSTGNPKGVMIEHRSLVNFTFTAADAYEISPADRVLQFASLSFDLSVEEIYPALTRGATVVLRTDEMISSARDFLYYCDQWRVTILDLPTAYWHELTDALTTGNLKLPETVRLVIIGGEKAALDRVIAWHKFAGDRVKLVNTYGPTETTVAVTMCDLRPQDDSACLNTVPIGRPLANATAYVLDESLRPVPIGAPGELHIGGPGVARGYVNRTDLTSQKFIPDPFGGDKHARLYKTGDLVRYRSDGNIEFLGRIDNQIKIRGFRVELEEIEQALRSLTGVTDCLVVLREDRDGDKRLIAYVVLDSHNKLTIAGLRNHLKTKLPSYMVPALFQIIDALPLLPSGKIDRRALPEPRPAGLELTDSFVAPRTPIEQLLAVEWCEVLKLERIGIHDNFFELGGHSLLAAKVVSKVRNNLEIELSMVDLFQAPTIASLAALLFPRGAQTEPEGDLATLLGELANLSDEEAKLRFDSEILGNEAWWHKDQSLSMETTTPYSEAIAQQLAGLSPAKRALLELRLMKKRPAGAARQVIPRHSTDEPAPLSYNQQGFWILNQLMPETSLYHTPVAVRLTGLLDRTALKNALNLIVARHAALRTTFTTVEGTPSQAVAGEVVLDLPVIDLSREPKTERDLSVPSILQDEVRRPFDLSRGPLIRSLLVRLREQEHILLVTMHHIVTDGWSVGIFQRELSELYKTFSAGERPALPELPIQYPDYSYWQRQWFAGELYESQLSYWKQEFATLPSVLELPTDHPRPNVQAYRAFRGAHHTIRLSKQLTSDLKMLSQKQGVTLFMMLLAAYEILLHRHTGEEDIVVGTPIAGRQMPETENLIGLFINTLPMRTNLTGDPSFGEVLGRVKATALGAYAHQDLPFERLVKELQPQRTLAHNPLFQVMFVLQSEEIEPLQLPGLVSEHFRVGHIMANFDLTLDIVEKEGQLTCLFESNADLFASATIERLMGHFQTLLEGIVANPEQRISALPLLTEAERLELLVEWNDTKTNYPAQACIQELFEEQVRKTPDAPALLCDERQVTYRELNRQANQLGHYLNKRGVVPDTRVGVCLQRSPEMIVVLLGILKAGGAYVPLDPEYPNARLRFMLEDAQVPLLITQESLLENLPRNTSEIICLDELLEKIANESESDPRITTTPDNLAYVMYTSGSTGKPKGVAVMHRNVVRLVRDTNYASFSADEIFLQSATISFDASTFEIWGSLLNGARLALMPPGACSLGELGQALKRYQVTTLWLTAGLFHLMVDNHLDDLRGVRQLLAGGDVLSVPDVQKVLAELKDTRLINGYGPTESTTFACCHPITDLTDVNGSVPIGRPISNTSVYILDRCRNPVPIGVQGELYIGGDGVARGYLDRPELNAERFVRDPFSQVPGARLYRTGDLVRYRPNGEIEFIGRLDNQVKVRGFRIELGEIESALAEHPSVGEAVVVARKDNGDKHLAAYLVPQSGLTPSIDEVREFLKDKLPDHMVPSVFVVLASLPLSPSGKVDRRALPPANGMDTTRSFAPPTDELELKLTRIWERVLGIHSIGVNDNFFELGGHSLLAVRLFAQIEKAFGRNLPLATLFQAPTVKRLARMLREEGWPASWSSLVMIQGGGKRTPFFCIHAAGGNVLEYHDLARLLGPAQPFYGLQAKGLNGEEEPHTGIKEMAAHYLKEMRDVQPEGPYQLGGRSSGGTIAFEMACQLAAEGQQVALLALLDTYPAGYFKLLPDSGTLRQRAGRYARKLRSHAENMRQLKVAEKLAYLLGKLRYAPEKAKHKLYRRAYKLYQQIGRPLPVALKNIEQINFAAVKDYVPQTYAGNVTLFLAADLTADYDLHDGWRELVEGRIELHEITGNHINIIKEPHVRLLAEKLRGCLKRAAEDHSTARRAA